MKKSVITFVVVIVLIFVGAYFLLGQDTPDDVGVGDDPDTTLPEDGEQPDEDQQNEDGVNEDSEEDEQREGEEVIGTSVEGRDITAHHFGTGDTELLFVGGIHGGYSWNTTLVAYEMVDYLEENPDAVPEGVRVTVIPVLNPDGLNEVVGTTGRFDEGDISSSQEVRVAGRFNANDVDLNRNFDCDWESTATWQNRTVDGGDEPFSEPESQAIRDYVEANNPDAAVVWYSAAGGVYTSNCHDGVLPETTEITNVYADASGYSAHESFDFYEITGDMVNWMAQENIPAISVLLSTHENVEWSQNRAGIEALLEYYSE